MGPLMGAGKQGGVGGRWFGGRMVTWVWDRDAQHLGLEAASETIQVTREETEALGGAATWPGHRRGRCHD